MEEGKSLSFSWDLGKLKVTNNTDISTNFIGEGDKPSAKVEVTVYDLAGIDSKVTIINIVDAKKPSIITAIKKEIPVYVDNDPATSATLEFSEALHKDSKTAVENKIKDSTTKGSLEFRWTDYDTKLTVKNIGTESTNFTGNGESAQVKVIIKDLAGNESEVTIINIADEAAPKLVSNPIIGEIAAGQFNTLEFSEALSEESQKAVQTSIQNATNMEQGKILSFLWDVGKLTVINETGTSTNFKGIKESAQVELTIKDLVGNESEVTIINIADKTTPKLVSNPIIGEIAASQSVELIFSEKLKADREDNSQTAVEDAIRSATTKGNLTFSWTDNIKVKITNNGEVSTNFAETLASNSKPDKTSTAVIKDLADNSATVTVINIPGITITGSITSQLMQGDNNLDIYFKQGENEAIVSEQELKKIIDAIIKAAGNGAKAEYFESIMNGDVPSKIIGVTMKGENLTAATTFNNTDSPINIPLDTDSISTAKRIFVLTINIPVEP